MVISNAEQADVHRPDISVVIPTHERVSGLARLVDALAAQSLAPDRFEVLVVDDASADGTFETLLELAATSPLTLRPVRRSVNGGPAAARNTGWRMASAPIIAFLDDDCLPAPGWLEAGLAAFAGRDRVGVVQGHTAIPPEVDLATLPPWSLWRTVTGPGPYFEGCNIFYRRHALKQTGGFSESIGWWGEDTALGWSVIEAGWERGFADGAVAVHAVEPRGWWWHMVNGYAERNVVRIAATHPGFRQEGFWRPWAFRQADAAAFLAALSLLLAVRWRPALAGAVPYAWLRRPSRKTPFSFRLLAQVVAVDAARCAGQLNGALRCRVAVI